MRILAGVVRGMGAVHEHGIVHLDLKPGIHLHVKKNS